MRFIATRLRKRMQGKDCWIIFRTIQDAYLRVHASGELATNDCEPNQ